MHAVSLADSEAQLVAGTDIYQCLEGGRSYKC